MLFRSVSQSRYFFKVEGDSDVYRVSLKANCDCKFMSVQGMANGRVCSHILGVFNKLLKVE